ncbi:hypothetical protein RhiJN_23160 [Ceratobasidium sp. AG-Ba]|nr:hypothetical protein RhiJN_23160 [Ceratobasidium sp. AG-Ba]
MTPSRGVLLAWFGTKDRTLDYFSKRIIGRPPIPVLDSDLADSSSFIPDGTTRAFTTLDLTPPGNLSLVFDFVSGSSNIHYPTTQPAAAYKALCTVWLFLYSRTLINAVVWKILPVPAWAKYVVVVEAVAGTTTFWPLRGVYCKELAEEYHEKDPESTSLIIGKPLVDLLACVVDAAGVISIDPYTKAGVVTVAAVNKAFGQRFHCGIHVCSFEM